jgi:CheY-like chemotaxis protein
MIALDEPPDIVGPGSQHVRHRLVQCLLQHRIQWQQVGVRAEQGIDGAGLEVGAQDIDRIGAEEAHVALLQEVVPELFQTHGGRPLALLPKRADHLAVGPHAGMPRPGSYALQRRADHAPKEHRVRRALDHEPVECAFRIEEDESAVQDCPGIAGLRAQEAAEGAPMLRPGDDQQPVTPFESLRKVPGHVPGEQAIVGAVELNNVLFGLDAIEEFGAGGHCKMYDRHQSASNAAQRIQGQGQSLPPQAAGGYFRPMSMPPASTRARAGSARPPGGYTVLVVDDEEAVRRLACRMLTWSGYQAMEATHGREAIATIEQHAGGIHLVLTDIKMPGMNGRELGRQVEQRWPGKPILYMSGFASEVFQGGLLEPGAPFLAKPFTQEELAQKVRGLLGG